MHRQDAKHIAFITHFIDSVTVRPFFEDLRRASAVRAIFRQNRTSTQTAEKTEAA